MTGSRELEPSQVPFFPTIFFNNQFKAKPQWPTKDKNLIGKTAIVTGSNTGLGYEAAVQLLELKLSHLIVAVRSVEKGLQAATQMRAKYPDAKIDVWALDLCSYDSIQSFAEKADKELGRLDIVILNAGRARMEHHKVESTGHEESFQVNYLSTIFLLILLLPSLKFKRIAGHPAHVTIAGAALTLDAKFIHRNAVPLFASLDAPENFDRDDSYRVTKLLAQMFLWTLVDYVSADDVIINIADPAFVRGTSLARDLKGSLVFRTLFSLFGYIAGRSPRVGASCYIDAVVNKGKESHGCFLMSWESHPFPGLLYTDDGKTATQRVWEETMAEFEFSSARQKIESMKE
ncbi:hypothetical protein F5B22DRAFT_454477 [Xylaria bambusicola]|uniref:uncharacterized protein n=1 Tax=Xylaria bambusicola TaxID=326684 RepID=UPI0020086110|nr:uncharacterized protein F5B22DRAFT_454477 [Xylaria bambusicola]KAI0506273.1 hypothetical protein F5B22DRAFT_454477 [Xylaria bambusicola]